MPHIPRTPEEIREMRSLGFLRIDERNNRILNYYIGAVVALSALAVFSYEGCMIRNHERSTPASSTNIESRASAPLN